MSGDVLDWKCDCAKTFEGETEHSVEWDDNVIICLDCLDVKTITPEIESAIEGRVLQAAH